jgi:prepilin-type N-terminal cleavage/methylation domain-containing protein/prepilin-type processing-associated H-X9-DG protein
MPRAFTMVELMVVIAIIGILVALLMPGMNNAWRLAQMTQCQSNLSALYKAQANWTADRDAQQGTAGAWVALLSSYLEGRTDTLRCPSAEVVSISEGTLVDDGLGGKTTYQGDGGSTTSTDNSGASLDSNYATPPEADIQLQDVSIGVTDEAGNTLYEIPLAPNEHWTMYQSWTLPDGRTYIGANIDNDMRKNKDGLYIDNDFEFIITYQGTTPTEIEIGDCDGNANKYWTDFRINHQPIWNGERFGPPNNKAGFAAGHHHEKVSVSQEIGKDLSRNVQTRKRVLYAQWTVMANSKSVLGATSYGLNRGSYQMPSPDSSAKYINVARPDPKLIYILDYPKPIADMTDIGDAMPDTHYSDCIFIDPAPPDLAMWKAPPDLSGRTWEECQALRHFGKANVLFCDGHVEAMDKTELDPNDPMNATLWNYQGK